jgi:hypothetical protein
MMMMRQAHNDSLNSSIDSRRNQNPQPNSRLAPQNNQTQMPASINSSIDFKQQKVSNNHSNQPISMPQTPSQQNQSSSVDYQ